MSQQALKSAKTLFRAYKGALATLEADIGKPFLQALSLIQNSAGHVVVSGMGKSGIIGRKIAATLASVWRGLQEKRRPTRPRKISGEDLETLPRNLDVALDALERAKALHPVLGEDFVKLFVEVKRAEAEAFLEVISPWEREYLLLNV